jgi:hypothetical protein
MVRRLGRMDAERARLPLALAILDRIRRLWRIIFGQRYLAARFAGDELLYQKLRKSLFAQLDHAASSKVRKLAREALPEMLPTSDELIYWDSEIYSLYESEFQRLEAALIQLALSVDIEPDTRGVAALFVTHDDYLNKLEQVATHEYDRALQRSGFRPKLTASERSGASTTQPQPQQQEILTGDHSSSERTNRRPRIGRKSVPLSYETAQRVWWEMMDEYEPERPSQADFCDRLSGLGIPLSARTLRVRISEWRGQNHFWPPPRPEL